MSLDTSEITVPGHVLTIRTTEHKIILAAGHGSIYIIDLACKLLKTIDVGRDIGGQNAVLVYSDFVIVGDATGYLSTYDLETGQIQQGWQLEESAITVIASTEGTGIVCGYDNGAIQIVDNDLGHVQQVLIGHIASVTCLFYATEDSRILSASESAREVRLWLPSSEKSLYTIKTPVQLIKQLGSVNRFVTGSRECVEIRTWNHSDGSLAATLSPPAHVRGTLSIESYYLGGVNGILTSHRDGSIRIWEPGAGNQIYGFETGKKVPRLFPALPLNVYEGSGEPVHRIVSGHKEGIVKLWRIPVPGSRPTPLNDDDGLTCLRGEKISRPRKSDQHKWGFASPLIVLDPTAGTGVVGAARLKGLTAVGLDTDHTARYQTVFSLHHIDETVW